MILQVNPVRLFILILRKTFKIIIFIICINTAFSKEMSSYFSLKNTNVVRQTKKNSCGAAALSTMLKYKFNIEHASENDILAKMNYIGEEASFLDIKKVALMYNIESVGLSLTIDELLNIKKPVIAYVNTVMNDDHFVIINGFSENFIFISDPAFGNYSLNINEFKKMWALKDNKGDILYLYDKLGRLGDLPNNIEKKHRIYLWR